MNCCNGLKIVLSEIPNGAPAWMIPGNEFALDLSNDVTLTVGNGRQELTNINKINDEKAIGLRIPATKRNNFALSGATGVATEAGGEYLNVVVMQGGGTLNFDILVVNGYNDRDKAYECELAKSESHWIKKAEKFLIKDIGDDLGEFELTKSNIVNNWGSVTPYQDGGDGFLFIPANYGAALRTNRLSVEDLRPWLSPLKILVEAFCKIGWNFESPYFESNYGRQLWDYILKGDYGNTENNRKRRKFSAILETEETFYSNQNLNHTIVYDDELNLSDFYDDSSGRFDGAGVYDFFATLTIEYTSTNISGVGNFELQLVREDINGNVSVIEASPFTLSGTGQYTFAVSAKDVNVGIDEFIYVRLVDMNPSKNEIWILTLKEGGFYNVVKRVILEKGDTVEMAEAVNPELTLLEYIKGCIFDFDGHIETDIESLTVKVFPPVKAFIYDDEEIEGYFTQSGQALTDVKCDTKIVSNKGVDRKRYFLLSFKKSTDPFVKEKGRPDEKPLFAKRIDRGVEYKEGTEKRENPLFEPTANGDSSGVYPPSFRVALPGGDVWVPEGYPFDLPVLWDNDEGKISWDIAPRRVFCIGGLETQYVQDSVGLPVPVKIRFEDQELTAMPYAFQSPNAFIDGAFTPIEKRYVYGDLEDDHYSFFWKFRANVSIARTVSYLFRMGIFEYKDLDPRKLQYLSYDGEPFSGRIESVTFDPCKAEAEIEFIPTVAFNFCPPSREDDNCDQNEAGMTLTPSQSGGQQCVSASASADDNFSTPPTSDTWTYSVDGGDTYLPYTPGTPICGEQSVLFRRVIEFEFCPPIVINRPWSRRSVCLDEAILLVNNDEGTNTARATGDRGGISSPIDTETWEYQVDGGAWQPYNEGDPVSGFTTVCFRWTVTFTNGCPPLEYEECVDAGDPPCDNTRLIISMLELGGCTYLPSLDGFSTSEVFSVYWELSFDGGDTWKPWDGKAIVSLEGFMVRATIHFCDECPPVCLEYTCTV